MVNVKNYFKGGLNSCCIYKHFQEKHIDISKIKEKKWNCYKLDGYCGPFLRTT